MSMVRQSNVFTLNMQITDPKIWIHLNTGLCSVWFSDIFKVSWLSHRGMVAYGGPNLTKNAQISHIPDHCCLGATLPYFFKLVSTLGYQLKSSRHRSFIQEILSTPKKSWADLHHICLSLELQDQTTVSGFWIVIVVIQYTHKGLKKIDGLALIWMVFL